MQQSILLVDDNPPAIQLMGRMLADHGELRFATSGPAALALMRGAPPDLVLLDAEMPGMSGFEVCTAMKCEADLADIPIIFVTGHDSPEFEVAALDMGAADFIAKPVHEPLLRARVRTQLRLKTLADELRRVAAQDDLTGTANRRGFERALEREWRRSQRTGEPLSLMIIDVDHFKLYNDHYGHVAGDAALSAVAGVLRAVCRRPADVVARYGGEEFAALLPNTSGAGAAQLAQHLLAELSRRNIPHAASLTAPYVTVSAGIASLPDATTDPPRCCTACSDDTARQIAHFVSSADAALYAAKRAGRAQAWVVDHGTSGEPRPAQFELAESPCLRQVNAA